MVENPVVKAAGPSVLGEARFWRLVRVGRRKRSGVTPERLDASEDPLKPCVERVESFEVFRSRVFETKKSRV
ncbi:MAG: hypothetical protein A2939_00880 [Parcubacteria group bacterium RIFCSPLOWO2_01_FULL_48_18]|nr:MAG: hypothetical protein A2939_00880 [Parcubacteria group bacterium RIFCSPLOWO2_01_FULL_48_18]